MVSWVSMIVTGQPQFETQDDTGIGDGVPPPPEWQLETTAFQEDLLELSNVDIDPAVRNVLMRLRNIFRRARQVPLAPTRLHDLTCFVIHRLLLSSPSEMDPQSSTSECIRYGIILYMFIVQGPTYYSHVVIFNTILNQFMDHLQHLQSIPYIDGILDVWLLTIGMAASNGTEHYDWLMRRARDVAVARQLTSWDDALVHIRGLLWLETRHGDDAFRTHWDAMSGVPRQPRFRYSLSPVA
ncbi:uncharacterized protein ColSpa_08364 [Colletotrichum spaethianum]|uniref:Uncharacterized protein n=1 Tax=Colletotrichum spaethianum TaxID=700344 RepID=A0AA37URJ3_9PEZI|nr:uncharacterized protein ColSpa_08364 [Colletotrichum spaethianum]GKT48183.1 hypothetical protein ColSpa_08364 [Colletotrichum spaethianum]